MSLIGSSISYIPNLWILIKWGVAKTWKQILVRCVRLLGKFMLQLNVFEQGALGIQNLDIQNTYCLVNGHLNYAMNKALGKSC